MQNAERDVNEAEAERKKKNRDRANAWYYANKERALAACKANRIKNKQRYSDYFKKYQSENREKLKAYKAEYFAKNKALISKKYKANYESNRKAILEKNRAYRAANPEKQRAFYRANKEKIKVRHKAWLEANKKRVAKSRKAYNAANPDKVRAYCQRRRAISKGATTGNPAPILAWEKKWRRKASVTCYWCRSKISGKNGHADHIQPLSKGGAHSIENLCISCAPCNMSKGAASLDAWNAKIAQPALL